MAEEDKEVEAAMKFCLSCKQDVPIGNFEMHAVHCKRFLMRCLQCGESINKNHLDEHMKENHVKVKCSDCGENLDKMELEIHQETLCRRRNTRCDYCEINLPACDIDEHKESCGSRTEECENCKRRILIKELEKHISTGCQPPDITAVERNRNPPANTKTSKPTSLYYDDNTNHQPIFPINPQFLRSVVYTDQVEMRSYIDHNRGNDYGFGRGFLAESASPAVECSFNKETSSNSELVRDRNPRRENDAIHEVRSRRTEVSHQAYSKSKKKLPVEINELPEFGIPDQDSDDDDGGDDDGGVSRYEKKPRPDLTDDTFLPCEFCKISLPADSLVMHQAMCQDAPPTPRPSNSTSWNSPSAPIESPSFLEQACGGTYSTGKQDIGEGTIPCEFCCESFPLDAVAVHQTSCSYNPLYLDSSQSREQRRSYSPRNPKTQPPPKSTTDELPDKIDAPKDSNVEPRRQKPFLAPTFSNKQVLNPQVKGAQPPTMNADKGGMERKMSKPKGAGERINGRPLPANPVSSIPTCFNEVCRLGNDSAYRSSALAPNSRSMHDSEVGTVFNGVDSHKYEGDEFSPSQAVPRVGSDHIAGYGRGNTRFGGNTRVKRGNTRGGGGKTRVAPGLSSTRPRGNNTHGNAFSSLNGASADRRGVSRGRGPGTRRGSGLRGQYRNTTGTVTLPNRDSNPRNGASSGIQEQGALRLEGHGLDERRAPSDNCEDHDLDGDRRTASGGHRLGGRAKTKNSRSGRS